MNFFWFDHSRINDDKPELPFFSEFLSKFSVIDDSRLRVPPFENLKKKSPACLFVHAGNEGTERADWVKIASQSDKIFVVFVSNDPVSLSEPENDGVFSVFQPLKDVVQQLSKEKADEFKASIEGGTPKWESLSCTKENFSVLPALAILCLGYLVAHFCKAENESTAKSYEMAIRLIGLEDKALLENSCKDTGVFYEFTKSSEYWNGMSAVDAADEWFALVKKHSELSVWEESATRKLVKINSENKNIATSLIAKVYEELAGNIILDVDQNYDRERASWRHDNFVGELVPALKGIIQGIKDERIDGVQERLNTRIFNLWESAQESFKEFIDKAYTAQSPESIFELGLFSHLPSERKNELKGLTKNLWLENDPVSRHLDVIISEELGCDVLEETESLGCINTEISHLRAIPGGDESFAEESNIGLLEKLLENFIKLRRRLRSLDRISPVPRKKTPVLQPLPRVLVIDDKYGNNLERRDSFCERTGIIDLSATPIPSPGPESVAYAEFCSGQSKNQDESIKNDYELIEKTVEAGLNCENPWAMVLLDYRFPIPDSPGGSAEFGGEVYSRLKDKFGETLPVVMLTSKAKVSLGEQLQKAPYCDKEELTSAKAMRKLLLKHGRNDLDPELTRGLLKLPEDLVAYDRKTLDVYRKAVELAETDIRIMFRGETGVGKSYLAEFIHEWSGRQGSFITYNTAGIPHRLAEDELFGHMKNAFSNAGPATAGAFEKACDGTIFFDELGDIHEKLEPKLLKVLESAGPEMKVKRLGPAAKEKSFNVRVISATLRDDIDQKRPDLLARFKQRRVTIPPLRERRADILPLTNYFLDKYGTEYGKKEISFSADAQIVLKAHSYPDNIRELDRIVSNLLVDCDNWEVISAGKVQSFIKNQQKKIPFHPEASTSPITRTDDKHAVFDVDSSNLIELYSHLDHILGSVKIDLADEESLKGSLALFEELFHRFYKRLAGASLLLNNKNLPGINILAGNDEKLPDHSQNAAEKIIFNRILTETEIEKRGFTKKRNTKNTEEGRLLLKDMISICKDGW